MHGWYEAKPKASLRDWGLDHVKFTLSVLKIGVYYFIINKSQAAGPSYRKRLL
jgi:hypothetical protein